MTDDRPLTMKEACEFLQVSHTTLYRWVNQGRLRAYKAGRAIRFHKEDLLGALEAWTPDDNVPYHKGDRKPDRRTATKGGEA
jgi:excisionase family DNA binding protein